jgi:hypothetical protein
VLNVGWLSREAPFSTGNVRARMMPTLKRLARNPLNMTRGYHFCEFCLADLPEGLGSGEMIDVVAWAGARGSGEIWVPGEGGKVHYAAPVLIMHYIEVHEYAPPDDFCDAVLLLM